MHYPRLLVYETDGSLGRLLRPLAQARHWSLREPRRPQSCLELLQDGGPAVLVLKLGRNVTREMGLLERVGRLYPDAKTVVVGDAEDPALSNLSWELGASFVLFPPQPSDLLPDVAAGLMEAAIACRKSAPGARWTSEARPGPQSRSEDTNA